MCEDFALNFGDIKLAVASRQITVSHFPFQQGIFYQNQQDSHPHPPKFLLFPILNIKLQVLHFDTIEMIEAEWQAVLNTLTEHDLQNAFKKQQNRWELRVRTEKS
jgi:hypothetical protein